MTMRWNFDMQAVPRGDRVFLLLREGEKGNGELAVGMICTEPGEPIGHYWTWGGPNSGSDIDEAPIAWAPLPDGWFDALSNGEIKP